MAIYSVAVNTTVAGAAAPAWDVKAAASNKPKVMELGINIGAATASTYGLGRSANTPTQTSPVLVQAEDPNDPAGLTGTAVAWSTAPTVPPIFFRRVFLPATIGSGIIFTFPRGLSLAPAGASLVMWNIAASAAFCYVHVVVDE